MNHHMRSGVERISTSYAVGKTRMANPKRYWPCLRFRYGAPRNRLSRKINVSGTSGLSRDHRPHGSFTRNTRLVHFSGWWIFPWSIPRCRSRSAGLPSNFFGASDPAIVSRGSSSPSWLYTVRRLLFESGSTWISLITSRIPILIMSTSAWSTSSNPNDHLIQVPFFGGAVLYLVAFGFCVLSNFGATRSVWLAISTTLLQQLAVLGLIFLFLRRQGDKVNREHRV
jgi:hypothetical protein